MATEWKTPGLRIQQQTHLAIALKGAGDRRALEKLLAELLPEAERLGLRGIARELRGMGGRVMRIGERTRERRLDPQRSFEFRSVEPIR